MTAEPSPEVKAILRAYVARQREKYGENWKEIKAAEMTAQMAPTLDKLFNLLQQVKKK